MRYMFRNPAGRMREFLRRPRFRYRGRILFKKNSKLNRQSGVMMIRILDREALNEADGMRIFPRMLPKV